MLGVERVARRRRCSTARRPATLVREVSHALRPAGRPGRAGRGPAGRRAAAGRDRQGADPRRRPADPRRADRGADPAGDRRSARRSCAALQGRRQVDRLHHPQAQRGQGDRRPDHRDPPRPGRRHRRARRQRGRAGLDDGRPRGEADGRQGAGPARARRCSTVRRPARSPTTAVTSRSTASTWRSAPARCSASPACRATGRPSWSRRSWACARCSAGDDRPRRRRPWSAARPPQVLAAGVGYVPEDRSVDGLVKDFSVAENLVLDLYRPARRTRPGCALRPDAIADNAPASGSTEFDIRTSSAETPVGTLSGGNQQKVIVAREMSRPLKLLIASQPTRGVDVGSTEFIHARIIAERDAGTAVLLVSSELDEVVALADRIAVMYRGRILAIVAPGHAARAARPADGRRRRPATRQRTAGQRATRPRRTAPTSPTRAGVVAGGPDRRRRRAAGAEAAAPSRAGEMPRWLDRALSVNPVTVTVLSIFSALVIGAILIVLGDRAVMAEFSYFFAAAGHRAVATPGRRSGRRTATCSRARSSTRPRLNGAFNGANSLVGGAVPDLGDAEVRRAADLHRPRRSRSRSAAACSTSARQGQAIIGAIGGRPDRLRARTCRSCCT